MYVTRATGASSHTRQRLRRWEGLWKVHVQPPKSGGCALRVLTDGEEDCKMGYAKSLATESGAVQAQSWKVLPACCGAWHVHTSNDEELGRRSARNGHSRGIDPPAVQHSSN